MKKIVCGALAGLMLLLFGCNAEKNELPSDPQPDVTGVIEFTDRKVSCIPNTLLSVKEDTQVDYAITVSSMDTPGTVYFSLYTDGGWDQEERSLRRAGEVVLHGEPGHSTIMISASCEMAVDMTIERIPGENTE